MWFQVNSVISIGWNSLSFSLFQVSRNSQRSKKNAKNFTLFFVTTEWRHIITHHLHPCQTCTGQICLRFSTKLHCYQRMFPWDKKGPAAWLYKHSNLCSTPTKTLRVSKSTLLYVWNASSLRTPLSLVLRYAHQEAQGDSMRPSNERASKGLGRCLVR